MPWLQRVKSKAIAPLERIKKARAQKKFDRVLVSLSLKDKVQRVRLVKQLGAKRLKRLGIGVSLLQNFLTTRQIIGLGFPKQDFLSRGCGLNALNYRHDGVTAKFLAEKLGFTREELIQLGFEEKEILQPLGKPKTAT